MDEKVRGMEVSKQVPIVGNYDVVICGGEPASFVAATAATRSGVKTAVAEQCGFLGGIATMGLVTPLGVFTYNNKKMVDGTPWEFIERLEKMRDRIIERPPGSVASDPELYKLLCQQMMLEVGMDMCMYFYLGGYQAKSGKISYILFENKNGTEVISADMYIDCTGDGDLTAMAGVPVQTDECKPLQPLSTYFILGGVDIDSSMTVDVMHHNKQGQNCHCIAVREKFLAVKEEPSIPGLGGPRFCTTLRPSEVTVNMTRTTGNTVDNRDFIAAEWCLREDVPKIARTFKGNSKEFKDNYATTVAIHAGIRETRRTKGVHTTAAEEYVSIYEYPDSISCGARPIDVYVTAGAEQSVTFLKKTVHVPYRVLVAKDFPDLLVTRHCTSTDKTSFTPLHAQTSCMEVGQAVRVTAAQCIKAGVTVQKADINNLIEELKKLGAII